MRAQPRCQVHDRSLPWLAGLRRGLFLHDSAEFLFLINVFFLRQSQGSEGPKVHKRSKPASDRKEAPGNECCPGSRSISPHFSCCFYSQTLPATCSLNIFFSQLASPFVLLLDQVASSHHSCIKPIQFGKLFPTQPGRQGHGHHRQICFCKLLSEARQQLKA